MQSEILTARPCGAFHRGSIVEAGSSSHRAPRRHLEIRRFVFAVVRTASAKALSGRAEIMPSRNGAVDRSASERVEVLHSSMNFVICDRFEARGGKLHS
jgi:hypothetical protein